VSLVRERIMPTERPSLSNTIQFLRLDLHVSTEEMCTAFIPKFLTPFLDTAENLCCLLEFCSKSSLHSHNGRRSFLFQNTKWHERHICYYYRLAVNHGNYARELLNKTRFMTRHSWADHIKIYFVKIGLVGLAWIGLAQYTYRLRALVNAVMNFWVP
jgi:hypothetical protein